MAETLQERRDRLVAKLSEDYAADTIGVDEYERRVELVERADTDLELNQVVRDLQIVDPKQSAAVAPQPASATTAIAPRTKSRTLVAIMGGAERNGAWHVPETLRIYTLMGGAELDFRNVQLGPGVTRIKVFAMMGGVDIIVPPGLAVECDGVAVMGAFEHQDSNAQAPDPNQPLLSITGLVLMGAVEISTRLQGESARQARKRKKRELKERARSRITD